MINRCFPLSRMAICMLIAFGTNPAFAQTSDPQDLVAPTVEVSANADASAGGLMPEYAGGQVSTGGRAGVLGNIDYMDAPFTSMNYTNELIKNQQARTVGDVLQNDPSVRVTRGFGNFQETYMVRGFALASDDMMYNGLYGILPRQFVAAELVERVELLRGANSFMNGATPSDLGALGGALNVVPKRAANEALSEVTVGAESGGQALLATDLSRRFGPDGASGLRLNTAVRNGDTSIDNEHNESSVFMLGFDHRGDGFRISADIGHQEVKLEQPRPSVNVNAGVAIPGAPDSSSNFAQPWTYSSERDTFGTLRAEFDLSDTVVTWAAIGMRKGSEDNALAGVFVNNVNGNADLQLFDNTREDSITTGEIGIRGKFRTGSVGHTVSANVAAYSAEIKNAFACCGATGSTNIYNPVNVARVPNTFLGGDLDSPLVQHTTDLLSVALVDTLSFAEDRLLVTLGLRHQQIKDETFNYNTGALDPNGSYDEDAVTPLLGAVYKLSRQFAVYGNYMESLVKGPVAGGTTPVPSNIGEAMPPAKTRQQEVGLKYDGGGIGGAAALFNMEKPLAIVENGTFGMNGEQRHRGVELSVFGEPAKGIRVLGGVTLIDAEQRKTNNGLNQGKAPIGVPDTQVNFGGEWDIPGLERLTVTGRVLYTSTQFLDGANTQELPSWTRLDIGARYVADLGSNLLTLRAAVQNLTDKSYWESAGGYPGSGFLVMGLPRTIQLSASLDF